MERGGLWETGREWECLGFTHSLGVEDLQERKKEGGDKNEPTAWTKTEKAAEKRQQEGEREGFLTQQEMSAKSWSQAGGECMFMCVYTRVCMCVTLER